MCNWKVVNCKISHEIVSNPPQDHTQIVVTGCHREEVFDYGEFRKMNI